MTALAWGADGLLPVVVQDAAPPGGVLMLAWANEAALARTLETGAGWFWSRSRRALWRKGETSGHTLAVDAVLVDCDADALLYVARAAGPACHTGAPSCFYRRLERAARDVPAPHAAPGPGAASAPAYVTTGEPTHPAAGRTPADAGILGRLEAEIAARRALAPDSPEAARSYVHGLLAAGPGGPVGAKITEEAGELAHALAAEDRGAVVHEAADALFHLLVGLAARDVALDEVLAELGRRSGIGGLAEKGDRR